MNEILAPRRLPPPLVRNSRPVAVRDRSSSGAGAPVPAGAAPDPPRFKAETGSRPLGGPPAGAAAAGRGPTAARRRRPVALRQRDACAWPHAWPIEKSDTGQVTPDPRYHVPSTRPTGTVRWAHGALGIGVHGCVAIC